MNILGIIPARAGSKSIKDKNIYPLCGKPLIDWTIESVKKCYINYIVVSTDIDKLCERYDTHVSYRTRLPEYCLDDTKMIDVIKYELREFNKETCILNKVRNIDTIILLQPTSPLRTAEDINNAIDLFYKSNASSLYSGYYMGIKYKSKLYDKHTSEKHFQRNGAIFIAKRELIEQGKLWDDDVIEFEMPLSRSVDIDTLYDLYIAEALLEKRLKEVNNP